MFLIITSKENIIILTSFLGVDSFSPEVNIKIN